MHRAQLLRLHGDWPAALEEARLRRRAFRGGDESGSDCEGVVPARRGPAAERTSSRRPRRRTGRRAGSVWNRSLGWRCSGLPRGRRRRRRRRFGGPRARRPIARLARACCPRTSRSCSRPATSTRRGTPARELAEIAAQYGSDMLQARWSRRPAARSSSPQGDAGSALVSLRRAVQAWQELEAPYEVALTRVLVGRACRALGDEDGFALELDAARSALRAARRGARPLRRWTR